MQEKIAYAVTQRQESVLSILAAREHWSINDIARSLAISAPAATKIIQRLLKKGMVSSQKNAYDRRGVLVSVTPRARRLLHVPM